MSGFDAENDACPLPAIRGITANFPSFSLADGFAAKLKVSPGDSIHFVKNPPMEIQVTPLLKDAILVLSTKRAMLSADRGVKTLALGSSHGDFGFNPLWCPGSFNLCCRSQDLKHSFCLYQKISRKNPNIRNLVIFYSVFSSGHFLERSPSESDIAVALNELFDLNIEYSDERLAQLQGKIKGKLKGFSGGLDGSKGFLPLAWKGFLSASYGASRRASDHLKRNRSNEALIYLTKLLRLAKANKHKTYVVIPPVRSDYKNAAGDHKQIFGGLLEILNQFKPDYEVGLIDFYDAGLFDDNYFGDYDHLLPAGPGVEILSRRVNDIVNR